MAKRIKTGNAFQRSPCAGVWTNFINRHAMIRIASITAAIFFVVGCSTYAADRYAVSMDSQTELKQVAAASQGQGVAVEDFTASEPGQTEISCRAVGPIKTPDGETFEKFIQDALIDQLKLAELYSPESTSRIGGNLDAIDFNTNDGVWNLALTISDDSGQSFTVQEDYDYESSFYGETACNQTAQAFMPAIQNLIQKVVSNPTFKKMAVGGG
jgi:hypothetical protein